LEKDRKMQLHIKKVEHHREIEMDEQGNEVLHDDELEKVEILREVEVDEEIKKYI
jgi:hypothetical protein